MGNPEPELTWRDGSVPVSSRFDDPYFSLADGLDETDHVFLKGNDLPARFRPGFHIAETGFGTGLNLLAAWSLWDLSGAPGVLRYTGFEAFPMAPDALGRALAAFPSLSGYAQRLTTAWAEDRSLATLDGIEAHVVLGDARRTLPTMEFRADAWFLDGFAPAKNPELWEPALIREIARRTVPGGTVATYTAAGSVRRALEAVGFEVTRAPGHGRKRHMTRARKPR